MTAVCGVLVEIAEDLGLVHVHPVAQRHEAAHPQALGRGHIQEGGAHGAALRGEGDLALGGDERPGGAHLLVGHIDPLAVGPHHPEAGLPDHLGQFVLQALAVGAGLGEAAGDDDGGLDSLGGALLQGGGHELGRDHHHRQVRGGGRVGDGLIDLEAQDLVGLGVDGVEGAGEAAVFEVGQDVVAQFARRGGGADDRHAFRTKDGLQAGLGFHKVSLGRIMARSGLDHSISRGSWPAADYLRIAACLAAPICSLSSLATGAELTYSGVPGKWRAAPRGPDEFSGSRRGRIKKAGDPDESSRVPRLPETTKLIQLSLKDSRLTSTRFVITN